MPGIAIGAVVLLLGAVLSQTTALPEAWRGPMLLVVVVGAVALAILALAGWIFRRRGGDQIARAQGDGAEARNENLSGDGARQLAETSGKKSAATNIRR